MKQSGFESRIKRNRLPMVVEFWAPWCGPCKVMAPSLKKAEEEFVGKVDLLRINADENTELLQSLGVRGIPTMVGYYQGKEVARKTGAMSPDNVQKFFAAVQENQPFTRGLSVVERVLRIAVALTLLILGWLNGPVWWMLVVGAVVLFSAVYDRCPVYKLVKAQLRSWMKKTT